MNNKCLTCKGTGRLFKEFLCMHNPKSLNICNDEGGNFCELGKGCNKGTMPCPTCKGIGYNNENNE